MSDFAKIAEEIAKILDRQFAMLNVLTENQAQILTEINNINDWINAVEDETVEILTAPEPSGPHECSGGHEAPICSSPSCCRLQPRAETVGPVKAEPGSIVTKPFCLKCNRYRSECVCTKHQHLAARPPEPRSGE